ncbi:CREB/ATF bZIP transcription factor [Sorex araneus]|uniref:CREB/ATF bZIP transcription factor n=1 Tax=Sorex araneus TaxID=42254 RepID=UPI002433EEFB|nr:CREB/ATF bZIP transcription factor [Sorex araneus]
MRHSLSQLLAASGADSPAHEGEAGAEGGGRAPSPREMEEEALGRVPGEEAEDMDFLSGLELADLLDPRPPAWPPEPGPGSPGPLSSSGGGSEGGGPWRADEDDEAAAAEMQRFADLLQRLLNGIGGGGGGGGGGEKRRRKGGGGDGGGGDGLAATRSPRKAAAAAARLNRLKKKEYVMGLESRVRGLAAENQELRAENRELGQRVQALQEESRYLRAVLANESGLARLLGRLSGVGLRLTSSLLRDAPCDHDYARPMGARPPEGPPDDDAPGGVCLHVDKDKVSVEFCAACARKAASSLKIFFFR